MTDMTMTAPTVQPATVNRSLAFRPPFAVRLAIALIIVGLIIPVGLVALGSGTGVVALPYEMFELAERLPVVFRLHMVAAASALLLAPIVIMVRRRSHLHRPLGRLLGGFVVIGGLTALPVAVLSHSTPWARAGFFVQGLVWLGLLGVGYAAIRRRDIARHAKMMVAMIAVTTGAVWFRVMTGSAILLHLPFEPVYALAAWLGWTLPLMFVMSSWERIALALGLRIRPVAA
jgi:hypothetical protein